MAQLKDYLKRSRDKYPQKTALEVADEIFTYERIYSLAASFSDGLAALKIAPGPEWYLAAKVARGLYQYLWCCGERLGIYSH